jgi:hypothetical protein
LLDSAICATCARNFDRKLGDDGFGVGKQAGGNFDWLDDTFVSENTNKYFIFIKFHCNVPSVDRPCVGVCANGLDDTGDLYGIDGDRDGIDWESKCCLVGVEKRGAGCVFFAVPVKSIVRKAA